MDRTVDRRRLGRPGVGQRLDDGASFGIRSSEDVGEDHHHHAHRQGVVERVLVLGPLPQRKPGDHPAVVEDAEPSTQDPVEEKGPEEADDEPDGEKGGRPAPVEPRAHPTPECGADQGRRHEVGDVAEGHRRRQPTPGHVQRPPRRHAGDGRSELGVHRPVVGRLDPGDRDRRDADEQERVEAAAAIREVHADCDEREPPT